MHTAPDPYHCFPLSGHEFYAIFIHIILVTDPECKIQVGVVPTMNLHKDDFLAANDTHLNTAQDNIAFLVPSLG